VGLDEDAVVPNVLVAGIRARYVGESKIPDDLRACRIGGANGGLAVDKSVGLEGIGGLGYVDGDEPIIVVNLGNAIHLNGEEHRDAIVFQFACNGDGFRCAPAVSKG